MKSFTALLQLASILAATALAVPTADPNTVSKRQSKRNPVTVTFYDNKNQQDALPGCKQKVADARICTDVLACAVDRASSIKVEDGSQCTFFEDTGCSGRSQLFDGDDFDPVNNEIRANFRFILRDNVGSFVCPF